jgi:multimeric flavodoxin WrbA
MKILIINASPRRSGTIDTMLDIACSELENRNVAVEKIFVNNLNIKYCTGCMACRKNGDCILPEDDGHLIARKINECDGLIIGTPVYWGNIPGSLKVMFDRIVYVMMGENRFNYPVRKQKGKKALILTACTTNKIGDFFAGESKGAQKALKENLSYSGFGIVGKLNQNDTKNKHLISDKLKKRIINRSGKLI